MNFSENNSSEKDAQLGNILDPNYKMQMHGVHSYEHLRPLIVASFEPGNPDLQKALDIYLKRIKTCTTPTGGAIGDEWIAGRTANATNTGYEYCSLHELMDSYTVLFQKSGKLKAAEDIENIFFNAAQGSRNPDYSCIAYLKTDNSYEMMGTKNGEIEADRKQTRYKYSPVHQDVAVCCVPNAGRISPYFLQSCWFKEDDNILVASVLAPNTLETTLKNVTVKIEESTDYPYQNKFIFKVSVGKDIQFQIKIRKPVWAKAIITNEKYRMENGFVVFERRFSKTVQIELEFIADVLVNEDLNHEKYFSYGALIFARPIKAELIKGRKYAEGFEDLMYSATNPSRYEYVKNHKAKYRDGKIHLKLKKMDEPKTKKEELIPFGKTILRQVTF